MPEDLTTAPEGEEITEEEIAEAEMEFTSRSEIIACCFNAISAVDGLDSSMMGEVYAKMQRRIQKRCVKILDTLVKEMYDETFFDEEEENKEA